MTILYIWILRLNGTLIEEGKWNQSPLFEVIPIESVASVRQPFCPPDPTIRPDISNGAGDEFIVWVSDSLID